MVVCGRDHTEAAHHDQKMDSQNTSFWSAGPDVAPVLPGNLEGTVGGEPRSEGRTIRIDTGAGNDKVRPYAKQWQYMNTDFLRRLAPAGIRTQDVDLVVNTHLHNDHVGWITRREGGDWAPTFPDATYFIPKIVAGT
jgi:glyoxylase-like metal-dependent hydrolase (beta-lactamase superfamily II)